MAETPEAIRQAHQAEFDTLVGAMEARRAQFIREYLVDLNRAAAAVRAGFSARTARQAAHRLMYTPEVARAIELAQLLRADRAGISADRVLQELWAIATADPGELIEYRRCCCRNCWGEAFAYQETPGEQAKRLAKWVADERKAAGNKKEEAKFAGGFDALGGTGFDETLDPNPECPECRGQGEGRAFLADTRDLSAEARKLYAGVKVTKDGIEVKMHDKVAALTQVGRHLGMFTDKLEAAHTGGLTINVKRFTPVPDPAPTPGADD